MRCNIKYIPGRRDLPSKQGTNENWNLYFQLYSLIGRIFHRPASGFKHYIELFPLPLPHTSVSKHTRQVHISIPTLAFHFGVPTFWGWSHWGLGEEYSQEPFPKWNNQSNFIIHKPLKYTLLSPNSMCP